MCSACSSGSVPSVACSGRIGRCVSSPLRTRASSTPAGRPSAICRRTSASGSSAETRRSSTGSPYRRTRIGGPDMQTYGMALDLRDDPQLIARYKKEHAEVWPEVVARLRDIGVTEMKIFVLGRRMFMYCETRDGFDPAHDFARSNDDPTYKKWDELMRTMQQRVDEARPGEWWAQMELVFDLSAVRV